jgi:leader peptidase (prepilin peptidase)/N-methyltransferase
VGALWAIFVWHISVQFQVSEIANQQGIIPPHICFIPLIGTMFFLWLLVGIAVLDAEHFWIADAITLPGIALGIAFSVLYESTLRTPLREQSLFWIQMVEHLLSILAAAGLILLIRWAYWLFRRREGIGLGDAKLMALLAAWLGLPQALLAFVVGVVLGALVAVAMMVTRRNSDGLAASKLPLGTFLCIGGIVSSLWGGPMIDHYLRWAGF